MTRKTLPHEIPFWIDPAAEIYFITINCKIRGTNSLCLANIGPGILESVEFRHSAREWYAHLFLLMPDHLHALMSFPANGRGIQKSISNWKAWTTKRFQVHWQRDFFEHRLRGSEGFDEKANYIRNNPVRAGIAKSPEDWPWLLHADHNNGPLIRG